MESTNNEQITGELIDIFSALTKKEVAKFDNYLRSTNKQKKVPLRIKLFKAMKSEHNKSINNDGLKNYQLLVQKTFKKVYDKIWEATTSQKQQLAQLKKELLEYLISFLVGHDEPSSCNKNNLNIEQIRILLRTYLTKNIHQYHETYLETYLKNLENLDIIPRDYFLQLSIANESAFTLLLPIYGNDSKSTLVIYAQNMIKNLACHYHFKKVMYYCTLKSRHFFEKQKVTTNTPSFDIQTSLETIHDSFEFLENNKLDQFTLVKGYISYAKMLHYDNDETIINSSIQILNSILEEDSPKVSKTHLRQFCYVLNNHFTQQIQIKGKQDLYHKLFLTLKNTLQKGILEFNNSIDKSIYLKMVESACNIGREGLEWLEKTNFIDCYKHKLNKKHSKSYFIYAHSLFLFYQKNYTEGIVSLNKIEPNTDDLYMKIFARTLACKLIFEQPESYVQLSFQKTEAKTSFSDYLDNQRDWLSRQKKNKNNQIQLTEYYSDYYKLFFDNLIKLQRIKENPNKSEEKCQKELGDIIAVINDESKAIYDKIWLRQKALELKK